MFVMKRDGRRESVHFDKITQRIQNLCYGLDTKVSVCWSVEVWVAAYAPMTHHHASSSIQQHVDPVIVSQKVIQGVYPGVTTEELDE